MKTLISTLAIIGLIGCNSVPDTTSSTSASSATTTDSSGPAAAKPTEVSASGKGTTTVTGDDGLPTSTTSASVVSPTSAPLPVNTVVTSSSMGSTPSPSPSPSATPSASSSPISPTNFVYVTNQSDNTISEYSINPSTGALANIGSIATGNTPTDMLIDSGKHFVYVLNSGSQTLSQYAIQSNGTLTAVVNPVTAWNDSYTLHYMSFGVDGKLYVQMGNVSLNQYTIDAQGFLHYANLITPYASYLAVTLSGHTGSTSGSYTYVINAATNSVDQMSSGNSLISRTPAGHGPSAIAIK